MHIALDARELRIGSQVKKGKTTYTIVEILPYGTGADFCLKNPQGHTQWRSDEYLETHFKRTGNTSYTPERRGRR